MLRRFVFGACGLLSCIALASGASAQQTLDSYCNIAVGEAVTLRLDLRAMQRDGRLVRQTWRRSQRLRAVTCVPHPSKWTLDGECLDAQADVVRVGRVALSWDSARVDVRGLARGVTAILVSYRDTWGAKMGAVIVCDVVEQDDGAALNLLRGEIER